jgi:ubiquinone/menaquinone biosynthesis C-methylase UbiE
MVRRMDAIRDTTQGQTQTPGRRDEPDGMACGRRGPTQHSTFRSLPTVAANDRVCEDRHGGQVSSSTGDHYAEILCGTSFWSRWIRYWFSPARVLFLNTPIRRFLRTIAIPPDSRILDLGCGSGGLLLYLQKKAHIRRRMEGVDASPTMVAWARREMRRQRIGGLINIRLASGTDLPYPRSQFDVVFSTYVIKHLSDDELNLMLDEVGRVLRPGGSFCIWEAGPTRPALLDRMNRRLISGGLFSIRIRSSETLSAMLAEHGFRATQPFGHAPYLYHPVMRRIGFICTR